jgi:hypothetical protein
MTTTTPSALRTLPLLLATLLICLTTGAWAQGPVTPVTVDIPLTLEAQPQPGQTFDLAKYAPDAIAGADGSTQVTFTKANVGKFKDASLELKVQGDRVVHSSLILKGPKPAKQLRKYLIKTFGNPTTLTIQNDRETMVWTPDKLATFQLSSTSDAADTFCTATMVQH